MLLKNIAWQGQIIMTYFKWKKQAIRMYKMI